MKRVLFVGDGKHDVGGPEWPTEDPFPAGGVVSYLAAKVAAIDREGSLALRWSQIVRLPLGGRRGYAAKVRAAQLLAERRLGLQGVVCVIDEDNDPSRREFPAQAQAHGNDGCPTVGGVAVRSIEAWTLGTPTALAEVLGTSRDKLRGACPTVAVEELYEGSGKQELRPKLLLDRLARRFANTDDSLELREQVADAADPQELCGTCPGGFAPFAAALRTAFGAPR